MIAAQLKLAVAAYKEKRWADARKLAEGVVAADPKNAQGRYVLAADAPEAVLEQARAAGVPARIIGIVTAEPRLTLPGEVPISLADMRRANEAWLPRFMAGGT